MDLQQLKETFNKAQETGLNLDKLELRLFRKAFDPNSLRNSYHVGQCTHATGQATDLNLGTYLRSDICPECWDLVPVENERLEELVLIIAEDLQRFDTIRNATGVEQLLECYHTGYRSLWAGSEYRRWTRELDKRFNRQVAEVVQERRELFSKELAEFFIQKTLPALPDMDPNPSCPDYLKELNAVREAGLEKIRQDPRKILLWGLDENIDQPHYEPVIEAVYRHDENTFLLPMALYGIVWHKGKDWVLLEGEPDPAVLEIASTLRREGGRTRGEYRTFQEAWKAASSI